MAHMQTSTSPTTASAIYSQLVNDESTAVAICTPVYSDSSGTFKKALGDGSAKAVVIGAVLDVSIAAATLGNVLNVGAITAATTQWDAVCGTSGGLAAGVKYYLSTTIAGTLTTATTSGVPVIEGMSTTQGLILLASTSTGGGTITGVVAGSGLSGGGTSGSVSLAIASSGVAAGPYTNANITVGSDGRITAAANGSGGGISGLTTNTVPKATSGTAIGNSSITDDGTTVAIGANKVTITEANGNTSIAGTFGATGAATFGSTVVASGGVGGSSLGIVGQAAIYSGSGSPNFSQSGNPGDIYLQASATARPTVWQKVLGSATTTGWICADTGIKKTIYEWRPAPALNTWYDSSGNGATSLGTATGRNWGASLYAGFNKVGNVSATAASSQCGYVAPQSGYCWMGNAAGTGGFYYCCRFGISDAVLVTTASMFVGIGTRSASYNVNSIATITNLVGVGCDSGDTNLQVYGAGNVAQARASLGASFPVNGTVSTVPYEVILYSAPNSQSVSYEVYNISTGAVTAGTLSGSAVPSNTVQMCPVLVRCNGTAGSTAVGIDLFKMYLETET